MTNRKFGLPSSDFLRTNRQGAPYALSDSLIMFASSICVISLSMMHWAVGDCLYGRRLIGWSFSVSMLSSHKGVPGSSFNVVKTSVLLFNKRVSCCFCVGFKSDLSSVIARLAEVRVVFFG